MENNNQKVFTFVTIATILILVIIFAGVTYAFFTANNPEGSTAQIISKNGRMLITYNDGTDNIVPVTNIEPSNTILVNKTFTLTGSNTTVGKSASDGLSMPYKVGVQYTSTFSDGMMHYYIKEVNRPANSKVTTNYVVIPETGKKESDYLNQTVPGNETYTGYTHGTFKKGNKYTEMVTGEFPADLKDQTITFNLIIQFPDNNENQDSEKGKTFNGKVVINREPSFADDSWSDIATNVKDNPAAYKVGDTRQVTIGDETNTLRLANNTTPDKNYTLRVVNNSTPEECSRTDFSQTACGFVVEFVDIVGEGSINGGTILLYDNISNKDLSIDSLINNEKNKDIKIKMLGPSNYYGGWTATGMRTYANSEFYNKLPEELRKVIIDTKVVSSHGSSDNNASRTDGNWESTDKIYLLSAHEVYEDGTSNKVSGKDTAYNQTRQLDYYAKLGVTTDNYSGAIKKYNGSNSNWWLRAVYSSDISDFLYVTTSGNWANSSMGVSYGFAPAFRIG